MPENQYNNDISFLDHLGSMFQTYDKFVYFWRYEKEIYFELFLEIKADSSTIPFSHFDYVEIPCSLFSVKNHIFFCILKSYIIIPKWMMYYTLNLIYSFFEKCSVTALLWE